MYAVLMFVMVLQTASGASHSKEPVHKNISSDIKKNKSSNYAHKLLSPSATEDGPSHKQSTEPEASNNENYSAGITNRVESAPQPEGWFKTYVIATLIIAGTGLGTIFAVLRQLKVTESQLALAARQWVGVERWMAAVSERTGRSKEVTVSFDIVNPTKLPLTLEMVETKSRGTLVTTTEKFSLIPGNRYRIHATFDMTEEMDKEFAAINRFTVPIQITVGFYNEMKAWQNQYFGGALHYSNDVDGEDATFYPRPIGNGGEKHQ
jgi:hypothetical protein